MDLSEVPNQMFAQKLMGDGYAILPSDGNIHAPLSGVDTVAFATGHAFGIETKERIEILIHIGIDTVEMKGEGFESFVKQGDKIKQGYLLCKVDLSKITAADKSPVAPIIFT